MPFSRGGARYSVNALRSPSAHDRDSIVRFLKVTADPAKQPVFVHCKHGADRTGTMCAIWRVAVEGWTKEDAIEEMKRGGYSFHKVWGNQPRYIQKLDIEALKKEAGIE